MDALLSAAGLKDIGNYFPDSNARFKGADSIDLLKQVIKIIKDAGYTPANISLSIQAEKPKLAPHINLMQQNLAEACGIAVEQTAVAAGTCEGLGFVGEGLGIAAYAVATLNKE